jgi:death on curing protein
MKKIEFLTLAEVIEIHADQIEHYGGAGETRDINLLSSAVAMPYASFPGDFLHGDIYEMAAAYAFHICQNHPFLRRQCRCCANPRIYQKNAKDTSAGD